MTRRASVACAAAILASSCAAPLMTLPTGPGTPVSDGAALLEQATTACRDARTFTAELGLSGRVNGRRARGRLLAGVAAPASVYLDAPAPFGASVFIFGAVDDSATLLLPRDRRVLAGGRPADVLEAVTGVPLAPAEVRDVLTGCPQSLDASAAVQLGDQWRLIQGEPAIYLRRAAPAGPWQVAAVLHRPTGRLAWRAEYAEVAHGVPKSIRLISAEADRFDLRLSVSQVEVNGPLEAGVFHPPVPSGYQPIGLDELRDVGPLAESPR